MKSAVALALLAFYATVAYGQRPGGLRGGDDSGNSFPTSTNGNDAPLSRGTFGNLWQYSTKLVAHAVLATVAFALLTLGAILIRLASFRGLWLAHALFQLFGYLLYLAAFALGIWMVRSAPGNMIAHHHPIIGIVLFAVLSLQPLLGWIHHVQFQKYTRRTVWSYGHLWLGRIAITLGLINGGLGLRFAMQFPLAPPSTNAVIGYGVAAGALWLLYVASIVLGERRRARTLRAAAAAAVPRRKEADEASSHGQRN